MNEHSRDWRPAMEPWQLMGQKVRDGVPDSGFKDPDTQKYYRFQNGERLEKEPQRRRAVVVQQDGTRTEVQEWMKNYQEPESL